MTAPALEPDPFSLSGGPDTRPAPTRQPSFVTAASHILTRRFASVVTSVVFAATAAVTCIALATFEARTLSDALTISRDLHHSGQYLVTFESLSAQRCTDLAASRGSTAAAGTMGPSRTVHTASGVPVRVVQASPGALVAVGLPAAPPGTVGLGAPLAVELGRNLDGAVPAGVASDAEVWVPPPPADDLGRAITHVVVSPETAAAPPGASRLPGSASATELRCKVRFAGPVRSVQLAALARLDNVEATWSRQLPEPVEDQTPIADFYNRPSRFAPLAAGALIGLGLGLSIGSGERSDDATMLALGASRSSLVFAEALRAFAITGVAAVMSSVPMVFAARELRGVWAVTVAVVAVAVAASYVLVRAGAVAFMSPWEVLRYDA